MALFKNKNNQFKYVEENAKTAFRTSGKTKDSSLLLLRIIALISILKTHWIHYYFLQWRLLEKLVGEKILILIVIVSIQWAYILNITYSSHICETENAETFKETWEWNSFWDCHLKSQKMIHNSKGLVFFVIVLVGNKPSNCMLFACVNLYVLIVYWGSWNTTYERFCIAKFLWNFPKFLWQQLCRECCHMISHHKTVLTSKLQIDNESGVRTEDTFYDEFSWFVCQKWVFKSMN